MNPMPQHIVGNVILDFHLEQEDKAIAWQSSLDSELTSAMLTAMSDVMDSYSTDDQIFSFSTIDLDLGVVDFDSYREEIPKRLRQRLTDFFAGRITDAAADVKTDGKRQADFSLLTFYLEHGYLPFTGDYRDPWSLKRIMTRVLAKDRVRLIDFLSRAVTASAMMERIINQFPRHLTNELVEDIRWRRSGLPLYPSRLRQKLVEAMRMGLPALIIPHWKVILDNIPDILLESLRFHGSDAVVVRRMVEAFSDAMLGDMVKLLEPTESGFINEIVGRSDIFLQARKLKAKAQTEKDSRNHLWEFTLAYLLTERGSRFNRKEYLGSLVRRFSAHDNIQVDELLHTLRHSLEELEIDSSLRKEILALLAEISSPPPQATATDDNNVNTSESMVISDTDAQRLLRAFKTGQAAFVESVWRMLIDEFPIALRLSIYSLGRSEGIRHNIAHGFPDDMLQDIVRLLEPVESEFIVTVVRFFPGAVAMHLPQPAGGKQKARLWEFTLGYLIVERGSRFNKMQYMKSLLRRMSAHDNLSYRDLLYTIIQALRSKPQRNAMHKDILQLLLIIIGEERDYQSDQQADGAPPSVKFIDLRHGLVNALLDGNHSELNKIWSLLLSDYPQILKQTLCAHGKASSVRRRISQGFSEYMLKDIIRLIEPVESRYIISLVENTERFRRAANLQATENARLRRSLWEFTLEYLLVERGSRFNKTMFLDSLLHQMAAHENIRYADLLDSFHLILDDSSLEGNLKIQLLQVVGDLRKAADLNPSKARADRRAEISLLLAYEHFDILLSSLLWGRRNSRPDATFLKGSDLLDCFDKLATGSPELMHMLLTDLQQGFAHFEKTLPRLSVAMIERLLWAFISMRMLGGKAQRKEFMAAISEAVARSQDRRLALSRILKCLIQNRPVDLQTGLDMEVPEQSQEKPALQPPMDERMQETRQPEPVDQEIVGELQRLLAGSQTALNSWLRQRLTGHGPDWLCRQLPDRLLARLVSRLDKENFRTLLRYADLIAIACVIVDPHHRAANIRQFKWQFILIHLFEERRRFLPECFIRDFVTYLAGRTNHEKPAAFNSRLKQCIMEDRRLSTTSTGSAVAALLDLHHDEDNESVESILSAESREEHSTAEEEEVDEYLEEVYIANAGLVLAAPFIPRLFRMLKLLDDGAFVDPAAAERAVHLTQYIVRESVNSPEYQLPLNKLLCGFRTGMPIGHDIAIREEETQAIESMLAGMIAHWQALGNTSIEGLRSSFLQRDGCLRLKDQAWHLQVEARAYDMLLDRIPWAFSTIKFPWMERVIHVDWR